MKSELPIIDAEYTVVVEAAREPVKIPWYRSPRFIVYCVLVLAIAVSRFH